MSAQPSTTSAAFADLTRAVQDLARNGIDRKRILRHAHHTFDASERPRKHGKLRLPVHNLAGERVGALVVQRYIGKSRWECLCDCKRTRVTTTASLRECGIKSCGECGRSGGLARVRAACFDVAFAYVVEGLTAQVIGDRYEAALTAVFRVLREVGIEVRSPGRRARGGAQ